MAEPAYFLTPDDRATLDRLIAAESRRFRSVRKAGEAAGDVDDQEYLTPEVFVARTPAGGIPALYEGSSTGTGTGTGTEDLSGDQPGYADCQVWRVLGEGVGETPTMSPLDAPYYRVYNMSAEDVPGDEWVLIARDKPGAWWVVRGGGATGALVVCGDPKSYADGIGHDTGTGSNEECPVVDAYEEAHTVDSVKFWYESFQVEFPDDADCGGGATGTGSGTGTEAAEPLNRTAVVKTRGYTGVIQVGKGDTVVCDDCTTAETQVFICVKDGLVVKTFEVPQHCPP